MKKVSYLLIVLTMFIGIVVLLSECSLNTPVT